MKQLKRPIRWTHAILSIVALAGVTLVGTSIVTAEYGDVVMNQRCDGGGVAPVIFPHWFHRVRFRCKVCHGDLGFATKAGGNDITMLGIIDGQYCGACHNGDLAWSSERCDLCHNGKSGIATQVQKGPGVQLLSPATGTKGASGR